MAERTTLTELIGTYWPILVCSFLAAFIATPICRRLALRWKIVDRPDGFLKPHGTPMPYLGGIAIFLGWAAGIGLAVGLFGGEPGDSARAAGPILEIKPLVGIVLSGLVVMLLGLFDDLRMASPRFKLCGLCVAAGVLIAVGLGNDTILGAARLTRLDVAELPSWLVLVYSVPITLFVVVGACNATNLIDGLDGLCSGVLGIISAGLLVLAIHCHTWGGWLPWDVIRVVLTLAMMGAALGFLPFNRHPAKVYMGDAGSMLLGLNVAVLLLIFAKGTAVRYLIASIMVFGLPIADTALAMVRRWRNGRPIMQGDRSHFYDQLVDRGWSVRRVVLVSYAVCAFFALLGCLAIVMRTRYLIPLYGLVVVAVAVVVSKLGMVDLDSRRSGKGIG